ncbi:MAG: hypothetical protein IJI49_04195 [Bacilli bacterium]|nr:hypothetical protein [Bacilli bacterium]
MEYEEVHTKLSQIKTKICELEEEYKKLNNTLNKNLLIDNKSPVEEELLSILNNNQEIIKEIDNII